MFSGIFIVLIEFCSKSPHMRRARCDSSEANIRVAAREVADKLSGKSVVYFSARGLTYSQEKRVKWRASAKDDETAGR